MDAVVGRANPPAVSFEEWMAHRSCAHMSLKLASSLALDSSGRTSGFNVFFLSLCSSAALNDTTLFHNCCVSYAMSFHRTHRPRGNSDPGSCARRSLADSSSARERLHSWLGIFVPTIPIRGIQATSRHTNVPHLRRGWLACATPSGLLVAAFP